MKKKLALLLLLAILCGCTAANNIIEPEAEVDTDTSSDAVPSSFEASASVDRVSLSWNNAGTDAFEGIQIRKSTTVAPATIFDGSFVDETTGLGLTDLDVEYNTTYYYSLFFENETGELTYHDSVEVTTKTYQGAMIELISNMRSYARQHNSSFKVIPVNSLELLTSDFTSSGSLNSAFTGIIDGILQTPVYFGPVNNSAVNVSSTNTYEAFLDVAEAASIPALVLDFCADGNTTCVDTSSDNARDVGNEYINLARPSSMTTTLPSYPSTLTGESNSDISSIASANNFLYIDEPLSDALLAAVGNSEYDVIIINIFRNSADDISNILSSSQVNSLKEKHNSGGSGGDRLVLAYVDIGLADANHYYWDSLWDSVKPSWMGDETSGSSDEYFINYWDSEWHDILYGNTTSYIYYVTRELNFDGMVLGNANAYRNF
ncbi:MAG: hypothetical protein O3A01_06145 [bacterium]|nr:hypothetical protein [bacterium]